MKKVRNQSGMRNKRTFVFAVLTDKTKLSLSERGGGGEDLLILDGIMEPHNYR